MALNVDVSGYATGLSLAATAVRDSDLKEWRNAATAGWETAGTSTFANRRITLTEGSSEYVRRYTGSFAAGMGDAGLVRVYIHDLNNSNLTATELQATVVGGNEDSLANVLHPATSGQTLTVANGAGNANLTYILGTLLTETSGLIAAGFKKFFNVASPTGTQNSIPDAVAGASGGLAIVGSNVGAATSVSGNVGGLASQAQTDVRSAVGLASANLDTQIGTLATATNLATANTNISTLLTRIPSALFSGITSLAQWLGLLAGKQTGNSTARTEIRATGAGSGTFDETTDSQEALSESVAAVSGSGGDQTVSIEDTTIEDAS